MLERAGISVVGRASNSAEALRYYEDFHPDVALVDIDLGGEDGFELAEQLARASTANALAVILVSTYAESDLAEMIDESPAVGFLQKFSLSPDAIRNLLNLSESQGR
jgi:DNA-binding NarL/FixJ family response regulator